MIVERTPFLIKISSSMSRKKVFQVAGNNRKTY